MERLQKYIEQSTAGGKYVTAEHVDPRAVDSNAWIDRTGVASCRLLWQGLTLNTALFPSLYPRGPVEQKTFKSSVVSGGVCPEEWSPTDSDADSTRA